MYYKYVSTVTLPRWSSTDRHQMVENITRPNGDKRNATRWHETTLHKIESNGTAEIT
jgi:hypothetical protein